MAYPINEPVVVADVNKVPALKSPVDVKLHPHHGASKVELWVANRGRNQMLVLHEPGTSQFS